MHPRNTPPAGVKHSLKVLHTTAVSPQQVQYFPPGSSAATYNGAHQTPHNQHRSQTAPSAFYNLPPPVPQRPPLPPMTPQLPPSLMPGFTPPNQQGNAHAGGLFFERNRACTGPSYHPPAGFSVEAHAFHASAGRLHHPRYDPPPLPPKISVSPSLPPIPGNHSYNPLPLPPKIPQNRPERSRQEPMHDEVPQSSTDHEQSGSHKSRADPSTSIDVSLSHAIALSVAEADTGNTPRFQEDEELERALRESLNVSVTRQQEATWEEYDPQRFESIDNGLGESSASVSRGRLANTTPSPVNEKAVSIRNHVTLPDKEETVQDCEVAPTALPTDSLGVTDDIYPRLPRYEDAIASGTPSRHSSLSATSASARPGSHSTHTISRHYSATAALPSKPSQSNLGTSTPPRHSSLAGPTTSKAPPPRHSSLTPVPRVAESRTIDARPASPVRAVSAPDMSISTIAEETYSCLRPPFSGPESKPSQQTQSRRVSVVREDCILEPWSPPQSSSQSAPESPRPDRDLKMPEDDAGSKVSSPTTLSPSAADMIEDELLLGVSLGFNPPAITTSPVPMQGPIPNIIALPYGKCPPMHIQAPSWRQLLKLMARMSYSRVEPTVEALALVKTEMKLRVVIGFVKVHHSSTEWRTIVYLTLDHPAPSNVQFKYTNGDVNTLPFSYTLSPIPTLLRDGSDSLISKWYTVPATSNTPYPTLPINFPDLAMYLQAALDDSRRAMSDSSSGVRKLAKMVDSFYPSDRDSIGVLGAENEVERSRIGRGFMRAFGRGAKDKDRGGNADTYEFITPFRLDEWG